MNRNDLSEMQDAAEGRNDVLSERNNMAKVLSQRPDAPRKGIIDQRLKTNIQQTNTFRFYTTVFCCFFSISY